jgi:hypothetical protein
LQVLPCQWHLPAKQRIGISLADGDASDAYQGILPLRVGLSTSDVIMIDGVDKTLKATDILGAPSRKVMDLTFAGPTSALKACKAGTNRKAC